MEANTFATTLYAQTPAARVDHEMQLDGALAEAMAADGPFVVDVRVDPRCKAPASLRNAALAMKPDHERTFPMRGDTR